MDTPRRTEYDAVVVGGGVIGLSSAWRAAQRGLSVLVIERDKPGAGASGVAAGMLAPVTEAAFGEEGVLRLNTRSAEMWPAFAAELAARSGVDLGFCATGALVVAADRDDAEELRRQLHFQESLGLDVEWLTGRESRRLEPRLSPRVAGAIHAPEEAHVDPRSVVRGLVAALENDGGEILIATATDVSPQAVMLSDGTQIRAGSVVVAAGCWTGSFAGAPTVRPVKGQILRLRAREPLTERLIRTPRCYVVSRANGEVVVGGTVEERGFDTTVTAGGIHRLLEAAWEVLPEIEELEFVEAAARLRPATPDNLPVIEESGGIVWVTGHYRHGVLLAPVTAEQVTAMLEPVVA